MLARFIQIAAEEDKAFRTFLLVASPESVGKMLREVLTAGPMPNGAQRASDYYGLDLHDVLLRTVAVVDEIEWLMPGFKKWLDATGFGNDYRMIAAFAKWADMESRGELRHELRERTRN